MAILSVQELSFRYAEANLGSSRLPALNQVAFDLEAGEHLLICGGSGSGKSTLCRALNGLIPHFHAGEMQGTVVVDGKETRSHPVSELFASVGLVLQQPSAQFFSGSVYDEIAYGAESLGMTRGMIEQRVVKTAEAVGVDGLLDRNPHELSGGEQHLVLIAAVLVAEPPVIVLDEPYAHLDPVGVARVSAALREVNRHGTTVVVSEHRLEQAAQDADRILVLDQGSVAVFGERDDVLRLDLERWGVVRPRAVHAALAWGVSPISGSVEELFVRAEERNGRDPLPLIEALAGAGARRWDSVPVEDFTPNEPGEASQTGETQRAGEAQQADEAQEVGERGGEPEGEIARFERVHSNIGRTEVLRGLSLRVLKGECLAIVGANGSGKTTAARQLLGLLRPQSGTVYLGGREIAESRPSELAREVGLAFQNPDNQFFRFTVAEEVAVGPRVLGNLNESWLDELMRLFGLSSLSARSPFTLSGGEKKRTGFAAALAARPELVVLDEPTAGQDAGFRQTLAGMLSDLIRRGQTVVLITHDLPFAEQHADRWAVMAQGRIIAEGAPDEIMSREDVMEEAQLAPTQRFQLTRLAAGKAVQPTAGADDQYADDRSADDRYVKLRPADRPFRE